jgi:methylaspartate mutase epsilon subunit
VLNTLEQDLEGVQAVANYPELWKQTLPAACHFTGVASDSLLERETFESRRREVLEHWRTGHDARNLAGNAQFLLRQPSFPRAQAQVALDHGQILVQPRSGVATLDEQIKLFKNFKQAGVKVLQRSMVSRSLIMVSAACDKLHNRSVCLCRPVTARAIRVSLPKFHTREV